MYVSAKIDDRTSLNTQTMMYRKDYTVEHAATEFLIMPASC